MLSFLSFLVPTRDQMTSYIRSGFKIAGGYLAARGAVNPDLWTAVSGEAAIQVYTGIVMAIIPVVIDGFVHSTAGTLKAASTVPGIEPIRTRPDAPPEVKAVAADPKVPNVQPAVSAYSPPPASTQRK